MSSQQHIIKLCAQRTGSTAQPGLAGSAGPLGASCGGHGVGGIAWMGFGPGHEAVQDDVSANLFGGNDSSFASNRSSDSVLEFDYKDIDYNIIHRLWRNRFA